jgi:hypothetical protein
MSSGTERILRERYAPETLKAEAPVQKSQVTWVLVMKAADHGAGFVFDACNEYNKAHGRQPHQSFVLLADAPGVGAKGDWVLKVAHP